jgi:hypothetical protein
MTFTTTVRGYGRVEVVFEADSLEEAKSLIETGEVCFKEIPKTAYIEEFLPWDECEAEYQLSNLEEIEE